MGLNVVFERSLKNPLVAITITAVLIISGILMWPEVNLTLAPQPVIDQLQASFDFPAEMNTSLQEKLVNDIRQAFQTIPGVADVFSVMESEKAAVYVSVRKKSELESIQFLLQYKLNEELQKMNGFSIEGLVELSPAYRIPLLRLYLVDRGGSARKNLTALAEGLIRESLIRIDGVGEMIFSGTVREEVVVRPDRLRMAAARMSIHDLTNVLQHRDLMPVAFQDGLTGTMIKFPLQDSVPEYLHVTRGLRLSDVAEISRAVHFINGRVTYQGREAVYIDIYPEAGHSVVSTANRVRNEVQKLNDKLESAYLIVRADQTVLITDNVHMLIVSLIVVTITVTLLVFMMLRDWRKTMIIGLSVPVSVCCACTILILLNIPVHLFVLGGMILGVGLVIDTPIVVTDAFSRMGAPNAGSLTKRVSAISENIASPLLLATVTTILAYIPLVYLNPETRGLFLDQAITLTVVLFMSLGIGLFVIPLIYTSFRFKDKSSGTYLLCDWYEESVRRSLRHPFIIVMLFIAFSVFPVYWIKQVTFDFLPAVSFSNWELKLNEGNYDQRLTAALSEDDEFSNQQYAAGDTEYRFYLHDPVSEGSELVGQELAAFIRPSANPISSLFPEYLNGRNFRLYLPDSIESMPEIAGLGVRLDSSWEVQPDQFLWNHLRIKTQSGIRRNFLFNLRLDDKGEPVVYSGARPVPLDRISNVVPHYKMRRQWADRYGRFVPVVLGTDATDRIEEFRNMGFLIRSGSGQIHGSIYTSAMLAVLITLISIWMVLFWKFRSAIWALIVMAIFPLSVAGSLCGILIFQEGLNIVSVVGLVVTVGISVNDAILKISTVLELLKQGAARDEAIREASRMRFIPIVLTSLTTIASCLSFYFGNDAGNEIQRAMSGAMIGGLVLSTLGALYLVPALMHIYLRLTDHTANGSGIPVGWRLIGK